MWTFAFSILSWLLLWNVFGVLSRAAQWIVNQKSRWRFKHTCNLFSKWWRFMCSCFPACSDHAAFTCSIIFFTAIVDAPSVTLSVKQNTQLIQPKISHWFNHTTQSPLSFLLYVHRALLSLTVATVTKHGVSSVMCRQAGRRQKSVKTTSSVTTQARTSYSEGQETTAKNSSCQMRDF